MPKVINAVIQNIFWDRINEWELIREEGGESSAVEKVMWSQV